VDETVEMPALQADAPDGGPDDVARGVVRAGHGAIRLAVADHEGAEDQRVPGPADGVLLGETPVAPELQELLDEAVVALVGGGVVDGDLVAVRPPSRSPVRTWSSGAQDDGRDPLLLPELDGGGNGPGVVPFGEYDAPPGGPGPLGYAIQEVAHG
jgi:hypothetical protein